jgi:hypothetical protein
VDPAAPSLVERRRPRSDRRDDPEAVVVVVVAVDDRCRPPATDDGCRCRLGYVRIPRAVDVGDE